MAIPKQQSLEAITRKRGLARRMDGRDLPARIQDATRNIPAKILAKAAKCSVRAAENAKQGISALSLGHFLNAAKDIPELRAMAMELMGCETEINPDRERALAMLVNSYTQQQGRGE
jgi:hypothetical protein